jgi:hypothetical protein
MFHVLRPVHASGCRYGGCLLTIYPRAHTRTRNTHTRRSNFDRQQVMDRGGLCTNRHQCLHIVPFTDRMEATQTSTNGVPAATKTVARVVVSSTSMRIGLFLFSKRRREYLSWSTNDRQRFSMFWWVQYKRQCTTIAFLGILIHHSRVGFGCFYVESG